MRSDDTRRSAIRAALRGFPVIPVYWPTSTGPGARCACGDDECKAIGKHPLRSLVPNGLKNATTDAAMVRRWWRAAPQANLAIVTGEAAGVFVVDVDPRNGGDTSLAALPRLPETLRAVTGGGGAHIYFAWPKVPIKSGAHRLGRGLDVKATGGYVLAAPSLHASGATYRWRHEFTRPAPAPAWLLERLAPPPPREVMAPAPRTWTPPRSGDGREWTAEERARAYVQKLEPSIQGSNGNTALFLAASKLVRGFELSTSDALSILADEFNPRCVPPWSAADLARYVEQAEAKSDMERGYLLMAPRRAG